MEGPRAVRKNEIGSLRELTGIVMRKGLVDQYPQLFNEDNYENLRVCVENGGCVSHVGMTEREAVLFGCAIGVCCIGAVCTHPDFRKRGLASACFDDAARKARNDGVDVMIVSGDRNLYRMRGCLQVGIDHLFQVPAEAIPPAFEELAGRVTVETMEEAELPLVMECYRSEPVRFIRPPDDYAYALQSGWVMNRRSDFLVVRERGTFRGYVIARRPEADSITMLSELSGDRHALIAAVPHIIRKYGLKSLSFRSDNHDALLRSLCEQAGLKDTAKPTAGTVTILDFLRLMERMRPRFTELLGRHTTNRLAFREEGGSRVFALGEEELKTDRDTATKIVFGSVEGPPDALQSLRSPLGDALRTIFPLPTLWYGLNYV